MVRRRKVTYIDGLGRKFIVDAVKIDIKPGMRLDDVIDQYIAAHLDDERLRREATQIKEYMEQTEGVDLLERYYGLGLTLQFIDNLNLNTEADRREALNRLYADLGANPGRKMRKRISLSHVRRNGEKAYMLAKLPREVVFARGLTWSHWYDILDYPRIFENRKVLEQIVRRCSKEGWASGKTGKLRDELEMINAALQSQ